MKQDRFLIGILIFIGLLVVAAIVLFMVRKDAPAYGPDDTPAGVLVNYVVALQKKDYQRAYGYLAEKDLKPTYNAFRQAFLTRQLDSSNSTLQIGNVQFLEDGEAWVDVTIQYAGNGLFDNGWSTTDRCTLIKQNGAWKIIFMPNPYWSWDWYQLTPVPVKQ